jgi:hypothetical protein
MSTDRPEFQPIESAPPRRTWPWAIVGAVLVAALLFAIRRAPANPEPRSAALANVTAEAKPAFAAATEAPKMTQAAVVKPPESPNVLGGAISAAKSAAMVAKAEFDREVLRTKSAQAQAAGYRKQIDELNKELVAARAQIASIQAAQRPPPPSDQEQILQTLAPVLKSNGGGQP